MNRTIKVKGTGIVKTKPDYVVLTLTLESFEKLYEDAMDSAATKIEQLNESLKKCGFNKSVVKTTHFSVDTIYESIKQKFGDYKRVFKGYKVIHYLKVDFDFESSMLAKSLSAIGSCLANPEISISFTVKDPTYISEEMLRTASESALKKAKILCESSGVSLGELISIDYSWGDLNIFSETSYRISEECLLESGMPKGSGIEIEPDDIETSDSVTFVWEIM